jgi:hypothetical protein
VAISLFLPQVTRIPITGPAPYNTLVCVQAESMGGPQSVKQGKLTRWSVTVPTTFKLVGFDQRVAPVFDHSTTAFFSSIGPFTNDTWLSAVDAVTGAGFDSTDGTYFVNIDAAITAGSPALGTCVTFRGSGGYCNYYFMFQVTSFVLCYEPPLPTQTQSSHQRIPISAKMASIVLHERGFGAADRMRELLGVAGTVGPAPSPTLTGDPQQSPCKCK